MSTTEIEHAEEWVNTYGDVLREAGEHWVSTGDWMTVSDLGRSAVRREDPRDVFAALRNLPPALGRVEAPEDRVLLRVRALVLAPSADSYLHEYVRVFWLATLRLKSEDPEPVIREKDLESALGMTPHVANRVSQLVLNEDWMFGGGSGVPEGSWERRVDERIRAVMTVSSVDEYIAVEAVRFWSRPASIWPSDRPASHTAATGMSAAATSLQPGTSLDVEDLHPAIAGPTAKLVSDGHYDSAVREGAIGLRDVLRDASGLRDMDGTALAGAALGGKPPKVVVADLAHPDGPGHQDGWRMLAQGCFQALRNPVAHDNVHVDRVSAMEALVTMSLVARRVSAAAPPADT